MQTPIHYLGGIKCGFTIFAQLVAMGTTNRLFASPLDDWKPLATTTGGYVSLAAGDGKILALHSISPSGEIVSWPRNDPTNRSVFPLARRPLSIAYGGGRFVAVTETEILGSSNAVNWISKPFAGDLGNSVTYGNGVFLARSSRNLSRSTDGFNWSAIALPAQSTINSLQFYGNQFVLSLNNGTNCLSTTGTNWTAIPRSSPVIYEVVYGNGRYVGFAGSSLFTSADGITWTNHGAFGVLRPHLTFGNGYFVAVGGSSSAYSRDGVSWTVTSTPVTGYDVIFAYGTFLVGAFQGLYQSAPVLSLQVNLAGEIVFSGVPAEAYLIESSGTLSGGEIAWTLQHTFTMPPLAEKYFWNDSQSLAGQTRFFRVRPVVSD